ncbi:hypothetical protein C0992_003939, partial [Termitomyces sp. T32_za158]
GNVYLPSDITAIESLIVDEDSSHSDRSQLTYLHSLHGGAINGTGSYGCSTIMHNSLYLALLVSPLMLLLPREYGKLSSKKTLLALWHHVGGLQRPSVIVEAERIMWKMLFSLALGGDLVADLSIAIDRLSSIFSNPVPVWISTIKHGHANLPSQHSDEDDDEPVTPSRKEITSSSHDFAEFTSFGAVPLNQSFIDVRASRSPTPEIPTAITPGTTSSAANSSTSNSFPMSDVTSSLATHVAAKAPCMAEDLPVGRNHSAITTPAQTSSPLPTQRFPFTTKGNQSPLDNPSRTPSPPNTPVTGISSPNGDVDMSDDFEPDVTPLSPCTPSMENTPLPADVPMSEDLPADGTPSPSSTPGTEHSPLHTDDEIMEDIHPDNTPSTPDMHRPRNASPVTDVDMSDNAPSDSDSEPLILSVPKRATSRLSILPRSHDINKSSSPSKTPIRYSSRIRRQASSVAPVSSSSSRKRKRRMQNKITPVSDPEPEDPVKSSRVRSNGRPSSTVIDLTFEVTDNEENHSRQDTKRLDVSKPWRFYMGRKVDIPVSGRTGVFEYVPKFHLKRDLLWFGRMYHAYKSCGERPSSFKVLSESEYRTSSPQSIMMALQKHPSLAQICPLDSFTDIHDFTVSTADRLKTATPRDLLRSVDSSHPRALSALHLPASLETFPRLPFSSEQAVWNQVQGCGYCYSEDLYPISDMRWGLASTPGTHHYWHVDSNGFGTFVFVETGLKLWFIATPKSGNFDDFMTWDLFVQDYAARKPNDHKWNVDLIVLEPGTMLISNTEHCLASHNSLMRLLTYYVLVLVKAHPSDGYDTTHVPAIDTWEGLTSILFLCNYFELYSALIGWDFTRTGNPRVFEASIKNRGRVRKLLYWFFTRHELQCPSNDTVLRGRPAMEKLFSWFLAYHAHALIYYKKIAWKNHLRGEKFDYPPSETRFDIQDVIREGPAWKAYGSLHDRFSASSFVTSGSSFMWPGDKYVINKVTPFDFDYPYLDGHVWGDRKIAQAMNIALPSFNPRPSQDNDLSFWIDRADDNSTDMDGCSDTGYISDTPPESPVLAAEAMIGLDPQDNEFSIDRPPSRDDFSGDEPHLPGACVRFYYLLYAAVYSVTLLLSAKRNRT